MGKRKLSSFGCGEFGSDIFHYFDKFRFPDEDIEMMVYDINPKIARAINSKHRHPFFNRHLPYSKRVHGTNDIEELLSGADFLIVGTKAQTMRRSAQSFLPYLDGKTIITILSKGIEIETKKRMSEVIYEEAGEKEIHLSVLSGATIASDIAHGYISGAEVSSLDPIVMEGTRDLFHSDRFRIYMNPDIIGVELCGALKNVVSIIMGIADAYIDGSDALPLLISRGAKEIKDIALYMGANPKTFESGGVAFLADLILSCTGHTRNYEFGRLIGMNKSVAKAVRIEEKRKRTIEGYTTSIPAYELALEMKENTGKECPIIETGYHVLYNELPLDEAAKRLMGRPPKHI